MLKMKKQGNNTRKKIRKNRGKIIFLKPYQISLAQSILLDSKGKVKLQRVNILLKNYKNICVKFN